LNQTSSEPVILSICAMFLVVALMTRVVVSLGLFCGVQPSSRLSWTPTVAPLGPHLLSGTTPVLVAGSNAPSAVVGPLGSTTRSPPSQVIEPESCPKLQPAGLLAMTGIDT